MMNFNSKKKVITWGILQDMILETKMFLQMLPNSYSISLIHSTKHIIITYLRIKN